MILRTRPLTRADWDVRMGTSLLMGEASFRDGFVLESTSQMYGLCTYNHGQWPITRGQDGWAVTALDGCQDDDFGLSVRIENLHISRGRTVSEMLPLVRSVQRLVRERGAEWVVAVLKPEVGSGTLHDLQKVLQQGGKSSPVCWLFWELGFVDVILEDRLLVFLWRNPAW